MNTIERDLRRLNNIANMYNKDNKKYVLNGGTQNWVLSGFDRKFKNQSKIKSTKINYKNDLKLANSIAKKFKIPLTQLKSKNTNLYNFQIHSERSSPPKGGLFFYHNTNDTFTVP